MDPGQGELQAALADLGDRLRRAAEHGGRPAPEGAPPPAVDGAGDKASGGLAVAALQQLGDAFGLSSFERELLLLCAGVELIPAIGTCCAALHGNPQATRPTMGLAMAVFPNAHWSAISPLGPLRRWKLVEMAPGPTLLSSPVGISERVLLHLVGLAYLDERLQSVIKKVGVASSLPPSQAVHATRIAELWLRSGEASGWPVVHLSGDDTAAHRAVAANIAAALGMDLYAVHGLDLPTVAAERDALLCLWGRDARLRPCALLIDCDGLDDASASHVIASFADRAEVPLFLSSWSSIHLKWRTLVRVDIAKPRIDEQEAAWRDVLGSETEGLNGQLDTIVSTFNLSTQAIQGAGAETRGARGDALGARLWEICRDRARPRLGALARRVDLKMDWDDLVLPAPQRQILRDVVAHLRHRYRVHETWGFGAKASRGLGTSVLFSGASGTGKTLAAEVLARELGLDLYCIDLSQMVSKYIGETEKNLRRVFDAAEEGGAVLLFDEADALFGKRSDVKDSHDRYANIEVSYLLQRVETYQGLAILTTNMKAALDPAFLRRFRFLVSFPFPDPERRAEIWRRAFPATTPTDGLDVHKLARLNVAGGNIRNIALNAAFLAADGGEPVRMSHLLRAARAECGKLEKPLTDAELGGWS
jgi:ATPase family protein associated with various cellular activities (AAA)/winged helix domain-containing protein